jgi:sugar phosphate isomerase/epimerase
MKYNRRNFLALTGTATTAAMLGPLEKFSLSPKPIFDMNANYELKVLATNWGFDGNYDSFFAKAKKEGYDGAELWCPGTDKERNEMAEAASKHGMLLGILFGAGEKDPKKNYEIFTGVLKAAAALKPIYINCHTARDYFNFEQLKPFFDFATQLSKDTSIPVYHETHRGRACYSAPVTRSFIEKIPALRLTADLSHWCAVHESMMEDQEETINMVLERTDHIHARIGHPEGPQVNDPRAPEWEYVVKKHFEWWDKVVERKKKNGERMTFLAEFGPPDYMWTLPYTRQPLSDQWAINVYMMQLLRKRYS